MADKKKMSVEEILAAARAGGATKGDGESEKPAPAKAKAVPAEAQAPAEKKPAEKKSAAAPKPAAGGKPSVADIIAMARGQGSGSAPSTPPAKTVAAKEPAAAAPPAKPAKPPVAKSTETKPQDKGAAAVAGSGKDTASILAAARGERSGPVSKAEIAKKSAPAAEPVAKGKEKIVVPPMPVRPVLAGAKAAPAPSAEAADVEGRRSFLSNLSVGFTSLAATLGLWTLGTARFMFPNVLTEPPSKFKVGFPVDFPPGKVEEKFKAQFGIWVVNAEYNGLQQIFALRTVCTHLGCTPNWLEGEQKFKCPCHGSGFYKDGINFEGPAPRPLERYAIRLADDGQLEIDKSKLFQEEMGQWQDPGCFINA